jgi:ubiquinone/menaquinone biosynthesis C-methylase UbiE
MARSRKRLTLVAQAIALGTALLQALRVDFINMTLNWNGPEWLNERRLTLSKHFRRFFYNRIYYGKWLTRGLYFFNLGVTPIDPEIAAWATMAKEKHQAQVYYEAIKSYLRHALVAVPERVLEVSTGLGGGLLMLSRFFPEANIFGLDYSTLSIQRSKNALDSSFLTVADAHAPPYRDNSFDLIINVESLHALQIQQFLSEARRILARDGLLVIVDFRMVPSHHLCPWLQAQAAEAGLDLVEYLNMTQNAIQSSREDTERRKLLVSRVPFFFRNLVNEMTAGEGSALRQQYESGAKTYFLCALRVV